MGTSVTIMIVSDDVEHSKEAIEGAFSEVERVEAIMNVFDERSDVSKLNKQGYLDDAHEDLIYVIKEAEKISRLTGGIFDITIAPLIEYIDKNFSTNSESFEKGLKEVLELVDYSSVKIEGRSIRFLKKNMKIVLNAIAKGYAVDLAIEVLKKYGIKHALINAGGDIRTVGGKINNEPWNIGIRDPFHKEQQITVLKLYDNAVATSGSYERRIAQGILSHIVNPRRPLASEQVVSSTVICDRALIADALATSLCLMDPVHGISVIEGLENTEAMLVLANKKIMKTDNFAAYELVLK
ncbi:MAG: FAD:protein FMN transferase [Aigarchaeota archaeon]|nr:FAD:protein FMN transferase [Aigarchaeota archaeon]